MFEPYKDDKGGQIVRERRRQANGTLLGKAHANPILNAPMIEVEFADGQLTELAANVIAENMLAHCNSKGSQYMPLAGIVDHGKDISAVEESDMYIKLGSNLQLRKATKGWSLCVEWKDGSACWLGMPCKAKRMFTLKRRNRINAGVNKRYHKRTHKFGIKVLKTYKDCGRINKEVGNTLWQDAIRKEMAKVRIAFKTLEDNEVTPPTFREVHCHVVYDVKMENFEQKACLVAGDHMTEVSSETMAYASVVCRESDRIAITLAALNNLEVKTADIENVYLTAPIGEKIC